MLLNKNNYPHLNYGPEGPICDYRSDNALFAMKPCQDHDYWIIEFLKSTCFDKFPLDTLIPNDVLNKIRNDDNTFLWLSNTHEAFQSIVEGVYNQLIKFNIPPHKVILMNESRDLDKEVKRVSEKLNVGMVKVEWSLIFEHGLKLQTYHRLPEITKTLEHKDYPKKFLNFNRRWRQHRPLLVSLLIANGLLDKGFVSLGDSDDNNNWSTVFWSIEEIVKNDQELATIINSNKDKILNTPPLYLDKRNLRHNWVEDEKSTNILYENSLFSVVNETNFFTDYSMPAHFVIEGSRFLSEKTFKPIANHHPFIMVSVPGMLDTLKELGYETFHPYIDETYDTVMNDLDRMKCIVNEIKRLSNLTTEQEREFIDNLKPIVEHNYRTLLKKDQFIHKIL